MGKIPTKSKNDYLYASEVNQLVSGMEKTASYIVRKEGSYYEAINGNTGAIDYGGSSNAGGVDGTDAAAVIQAALDNLTSGRKIAEVISFKGEFPLDNAQSLPIKLPSYITLKGGHFKLGDNINKNMFENEDQVNGNSHINLLYGVYDGNKGKQTSYCKTFYFSLVTDSLVFGIEAKNSHQEGILFEFGKNIHVSHSKFTDNGYGGICLADCLYSICAYNYVEGNNGLAHLDFCDGNRTIVAFNHVVGGLGTIWAILVEKDNNLIYGNLIENTPRGINCGPYSDTNMITANRIKGVSGDILFLDGSNNIAKYNDFRGSTGSIVISGSGHVIKYNEGYVTENSGTATITAGNTSVDVTHGLDITPDINKVDLTPKTDTGGKRWWVEAHPTTPETYFVIKIDSSHTSDITFGWSYD